MKTSYKFPAYIFGVFAASSILIQILKRTPVNDWPNFDWPISIGWGVMLIPSLIVTYLHYRETRDKLKLWAVIMCAVVWAAEYFLHFDPASKQFVGYNMVVGSVLYACLSVLCYVVFDQKMMGYFSFGASVFGALIVAFVSSVVSSDDNFFLRLGWCAATAAAWFVPVYEILRMPPNATETKTDSGEYEQKLAA